MYCRVLYYPDANERLLGMMSEENRFDSVLFIFDGCRRYKFEKGDLGIDRPSDLLLRNQGVLSLLNPSWSYHLYLLSERFTYSLDSLYGKIARLRVSAPVSGECHVFISCDKHNLALLYSLDGELTAVHRRLRQGVFRLNKKEIPDGYRGSDWAEINRLLSDIKTTHRNTRNKFCNK